MFILDSGRFGADPDAAAQEITGMLSKVGGAIVAHRPWQDSKLAYEINGHRKGLYYLVFFTAESATLNGLQRLVALNESIVRHLVIRHPKSLFDQMVDMISGGDAFRLVNIDEPREAREPAVEGAVDAVAIGD